MKIITSVIGCLLILAVICNTSCRKNESRIVDSAEDVRKLAPETWALWARALPDDDIGALSHLKDLRQLDFSAGYGSMPAKLTARGVERLAALNHPKLETLILSYCQGISNAAFPHVAKMSSVRWLGLLKCDGITDPGLKHLITMTNLGTLDLRGCVGITDAALPYLTEMKHLKGIELGGCQNFSEDAVKSLQAALPGCVVRKDEREWSFHK